MKLRSTFIMLLCSVALIGTNSCKTMDMARLSQAGGLAMQGLSVTNDQLIDAVHKSVQQMDASNKVAPANSPYTQRLNKLTQGLTTTGTVPLNFKVYLTNDINAFACPDGSVRVYSGIMDLMTDDELLGIIGHEIGHVAMEHSLNSYKQQYMNMALLQAVGATNATLAALTDSQLGQLLNAGLSAKFSRTQENQADEFGYDFLKGAGHNPYAMVQAFQKMLKLEQNAKTQSQMGSNMQNMFSSHPETQERIDRLTKLCKRDGYIK